MKQFTISFSALAISVALVGCGGGDGDGGKAESKKKSGGTPPKASDNQKPAEASLATFLKGKKIVVKDSDSPKRAMFIFEEIDGSPMFAMALETPKGYRKRDFPQGAYEVDGLEVEMPDGYFLDFSSKTPKAGDTIKVRESADADVPEPSGPGDPSRPGDPSGPGDPNGPGDPSGPGEPSSPGDPSGSGKPLDKVDPQEPRIVATFIIDKIIDADESVKFIDPKKSQADQNRMLKSINHLRQMHSSLPGAYGGYPAGWGDSLLKKWDDEDTLEIFLSPRLPGYEKLRAQLEAQLKAGKDISKEARISHYALNKSLIGKTINDVTYNDVKDVHATVLIFECELGWNGAGGLEDALKFMDKHQLNTIAVVLVDGNGKPVTREELKKLTWKVGP